MNKPQQHQKRVEEQLREVFGKVLPPQVIHSVALNCGYNLQRASSNLADLSSQLDNHNKSKKKKPNHQKPKPAAQTLRQEPKPQKSPPRHVIKPPKRDQHITQVANLIRRGYKVLVIVRGLPGSGKSTLARFLVDATVGYAVHGDYQQFIFSADDFFLQNGVYAYNPNQIPDAHAWNQRRAYEAMKSGVSPVIIDNTNIQMWQLKSYVMMAMEFAYIIEVLEPSTPWAFNDKELARRTIHGVPRVKLKEMLAAYEKNITPEKLMSAYNLKYLHRRPPQLRSYPPISNGFSPCSPHPNNLTNAKTATAPAPTPQANTWEPPNLMNFEDDTLEAGVLTSDDDEENAKVSVDDLFSCAPEDASGEVLVPSVLNWASSGEDLWELKSDNEESSESSEVKEPEEAAKESPSSSSSPKAPSSPKTPSSPKNPKLYPDLNLAAWGIDEAVLQSWNMYTPIRDEFSNDNNSEHKETAPIPELELVNRDTNTSSADFALLSSSNVPPDVKVLSGQVRDISEGIFKLSFVPQKRAMLDKSCETGEDFLVDNAKDESKDIEQLVSIFPNIPLEYLKEIYEKCKGDVNWAVELLFDDNKQALASLKVDTNHPSESLRNDFRKKLDFAANFCTEKVLQLTNSVLGIHEAKPASKIETCCSTSGADTIMIDSDIEMDDNDTETASNHHQQQMMEINLGETLVTELENKLKEPSFVYPKGFQPIIQIPVALARQLYAFYVESVYQQLDAQNEILDTLVKEDEEFAKKLQAQENNQLRNKPQQSLQPEMSLNDIMNEQFASSLHQKEVDKWKNLTPDDLAAKLTKKKLLESFPSVDADVLVEIWQAHGNKYEETVESILASNPELVNGSKESIAKPPISEEVVEEMKEAHYNSRQLPENPETVKDAVSYREEASVYLEKRVNLYAKAQEAYKKGMTEVALFYSELARRQTQLYEYANGLAASAFLSAHSKRLEKYDTLDLHCLYVKEAVSALDMFLDNNIHLLKGTSKSQALMVITGRGKRSENGVPKIKPAVISRLRKRKLCYIELNPGLLKIKVNENSVITSDLL